MADAASESINGVEGQSVLFEFKALKREVSNESSVNERSVDAKGLRSQRFCATFSQVVKQAAASLREPLMQ